MVGPVGLDLCIHTSAFACDVDNTWCSLLGVVCKEAVATAAVAAAAGAATSSLITRDNAAVCS